MPVALPILIPFMVVLSAMAVLALHQTENMWLRPLLNSLAHPRGSFLRRLALRTAGFLVSGVLFVEKAVRGALSRWAVGHLHALVRWFHGLAQWAHGINAEVGEIAHDVADALGYLRHHAIPSLIHAAVSPVARLAHRALHAAHVADAYAHALERRLLRGIDRLEHRLVRRFERVFHGIDAFVRHTVWPRLRTAERELTHVVTRDLPAIRRGERALARRLSRVEKALALGVIGALMYRVLARVAPWLFCRNWKKVGNAVCGLNPSRLDALLALLLGAFLVRDLRTVAEWASGVEDEAAHGLAELLSAGDLPRGRFTID